MNADIRVDDEMLDKMDENRNTLNMKETDERKVA